MLKKLFAKKEPDEMSCLVEAAAKLLPLLKQGKVIEFSRTEDGQVRMAVSSPAEVEKG